MGFVTQLAGLAGGNVTFTTIPVTSIDGQGDYGESIVTIDAAEVHRFMDDLAKSHDEATDEAKAEDKDKQKKADKDKDVDPNINIHVLNAGNIDGLASGIGSWLEGKGYTVERSANAQPGIYSESQVVAADPTSKEAKALAKKLGGLPAVSYTHLTLPTTPYV